VIHVTRSYQRTKDVTRCVFESPNAFGSRVPPGSDAAVLSARPDSLAAIRGGVLLLRGKEGRERGGRGGEKMEGKGRGLPSLYLTSGYGPEDARTHLNDEQREAE